MRSQRTLLEIKKKEDQAHKKFDEAYKGLRVTGFLDSQIAYDMFWECIDAWWGLVELVKFFDSCALCKIKSCLKKRRHLKIARRKI